MSNTEITHSFSREVAKKHGVNAAIILGYLGHKIQHSQHIHDKKRWYYETLDELVKRYPYMSRTPVYEAIQRLTVNNGPLVIGNYNKKGYDRTNWYAFRDERTAQQLQTQPLYFKMADAVAYGVVEAILIGNLRYWMAEKRKEQPDYSFHPLSTKTLANHLPFSRSTIQRALDNLVAKGVFIPRQPTNSRKSTEYGFATGSETGTDQASCGSNPNKLCEIPEPAQNRIPNMAGSDQNMSGSNPNMAGSIRNMAGSNPNNYTILIDDSLKDPHLKEVCLKEDYFKASASIIPSQTPGADQTLASHEQNGTNEVCDAIVASVACDPNGQAQVIPVVPGTHPDANTAPLDMPADSTPAPKSAHWTGCDPDNFSGLTFLDETVHKACWEVYKFHCKDSDPTTENLADAIVGTALALIRRTNPAEILRLFRLPDQAELNAQLTLWFKSFFEHFYDTRIVSGVSPETDPYRQMFLEHSLCFLNMAFHYARFGHPAVYTHYTFNRITVEILTHIEPLKEEEAAQKRANQLQERRIKYGSPDQAKETEADLSAPEKMQVFSQSLQARNRIGQYDEYGRHTQQVVLITRNTLSLARTFFQLNPHFTVADINKVIDACLTLPRLDSAKETDPLWHARNGHRISLLLTSLATVASQLNMLSDLPAFTPLPAEESQNDAQEN